jgi:hypothetical protein
VPRGHDWNEVRRAQHLTTGWNFRDGTFSYFKRLLFISFSYIIWAEDFKMYDVNDIEDLHARDFYANIDGASFM